MIEHPYLYEINTAVWLYALSQEAGRQISLGEVPHNKWDEIRDMGFDYVWLMGVWKRSRLGVQIFRNDPEYLDFKRHLDNILPGWTEDDIIGSPYSVASYVPDSFVGSWEDIDHARNQLHRRGIGLILDFVPNHTAPDHPWIREHPDYYIQGTLEEYEENSVQYTVVTTGERRYFFARGKDPYFPPWTDTVQLNYFNPELRRALIEELQKIAGHCDGVRCDMAMLVLNDIFRNTWSKWSDRLEYSKDSREFWQEVREALPEFLLMAEAYWDTEWQLQQIGFNFVYDKRLYDKMVSSSPHDIHLHLKADIEYQRRLVRFMENHDEKRSARGFSGESIFPSAVLFSTLPGMKLFYQGQTEGKQIRIPVQMRRDAVEKRNDRIHTFYERLLCIVRKEVFKGGEWKLREVWSLTDDKRVSLLAYTWTLENTRKLIVVNITSKTLSGRIEAEEIDSDRDYVLTDELHDKIYIRKGKDMASSGLTVVLNAFQSHIFDISPKK